jgi:hypothetical protein
MDFCVLLVLLFDVRCFVAYPDADVRVDMQGDLICVQVKSGQIADKYEIRAIRPVRLLRE